MKAVHLSSITEALYMELPDELLCIYSAKVSEQADSYHIEVPKREVQHGAVQSEKVHRVALLGTEKTESENEQQDQSTSQPPVEEGEQRTVDIEDIGEQGDGIARVERGFVVIVPDTEQGERVRVEVTDVQQTVAFAEVVDREDYYL